MEIKIYRKETGNKRPAPKKEQLERLTQELELRCRVRRPGLEALFIPAPGKVSAFYKMPALSQRTIDDRATRILDHSDAGFVVPMDSLGRAGEVSKQQADSINIWLAKNLSAVVNPDDFSVVVE